MRKILLVGAMTLLALAAAPAQAQWKWKDARGQVHASDLPPPREVLDKDILQRPSPAAKSAAGVAASASGAASAASAVGAAASRASTTDPELEARKAKAEAEQKSKAKLEEDKLAAQRRENCQRARQHLASLESGQRIARLNAQGEREILDDKARADESAAARRVIEADCR